MGVDLRRRDRRVAKQLLYSSQVRSRVKQMSREGVSERVRAEAGVLSDLVEKPRHDLLDATHADALAGPSDEDREPVDLAAERRRDLVTLSLVVPECARRMVADGNDAFLSALPAHLHLLADGIDVRPIQTLQLRETHPRGIEQLENGGIANVHE